MKLIVFLFALLAIAASAEVPSTDAVLPVVNIHYDFQAQDVSSLSNTKKDMASWEARADRIVFGIDRTAQELTDFVNLENNILEDTTQVLKSPLLRGNAKK
jgi:hypothetical protein